jgi:hypothetical protein
LIDEPRRLVDAGLDVRIGALRHRAIDDVDGDGDRQYGEKRRREENPVRE